MSTRRGFAVLTLTAALSLGCLGAEVPSTSPATHSRKSRKAQLAPLPPPLPSGPRGPVPQMPLDTMQPMAPQVSYRDGQLTIVAPNSTLGDILRAVRKQTSADIEIPPTASERVVTRIGPGPARDVVAELLNGSKFNYVLLGSPSNSNLLMRVVLVAKSGSDQAPTPQQAGGNPNMAPPPPDAAPDTTDADAAPADDAQDDSADQNAAAAEVDQTPPPDQSGVKTPQQMLQEMQQRQLLMQQQLAPGQPPIPGGGIPRPQDQ